MVIYSCATDLGLSICNYVSLFENKACRLMVRLVAGSIPHGGPIELFVVSATATRLVKKEKENKGRGMYYLGCGKVHITVVAEGYLGTICITAIVKQIIIIIIIIILSGLHLC